MYINPLYIKRHDWWPPPPVVLVESDNFFRLKFVFYIHRSNTNRF